MLAKRPLLSSDFSLRFRQFAERRRITDDDGDDDNDYDYDAHARIRIRGPPMWSPQVDKK